MVDDVDCLLERLMRMELLLETEVRQLCEMAIDILSTESVVQSIDAPVTICGDIHGQFHDLLELFQIGGECPLTNYIFLGDFVDRGQHSLETILLLLALKVRYPDRMTLIRGNHESRQVTKVYGFYDECLRKYGSTNVWRYCTDAFDYFSLAAVVGEQVLCVHGGISPLVESIDQIRAIDHIQEVPHLGPMADLMWSDPYEGTGYHISPRGAGVLFGGDVVEAFNHANGLSLIARAHQLVLDGYRSMFPVYNQSSGEHVHALVTVWSAPNYCHTCGNVAAVMELDEQLNRNFKLFSAAPDDAYSGNPRQITPNYFL